MKKQYTIKDIAEELNLHHTTVSRALRNHPDVNAKTREAVLEAVEKYNYIPNSFAKSLRSAKSKTIVVMVPAIKNFFFSEVLGVISNLAFKEGYSVMIYQSNEEGEMEKQNLAAIMANRVAGVISSVANIRENQEKYQQLENLGIPVVLFDRCFDGTSFSRIQIDNYQGAFEATKYLIELGRKKIGFYRGIPGNPVFEDRFKGYSEAMREHSLAVREEFLFEGGIQLEHGIRLVHELSGLEEKPDALLCVVDMVALGVIAGSRELNMDIPGDLALVGFDNEPAGRIIRPALTTVSQPVERVGAAAFDLLHARINNMKDQAENEVILKMELLKRNSA